MGKLKFIFLFLLLPLFSFADSETLHIQPRSTAPYACDPSRTGTFYVSFTNAYYCDGTTWTAISALDSASCSDCLGPDQIDETATYAFSDSGNTFTGDLTGDVTGDLTGNVTGDVTGAVTGNASTATALAANGANCSAGNYPLGISAAGAAEDCTDASTLATLNLTPSTSPPVACDQAGHLGKIYYDTSDALCVCTVVSASEGWAKLVGDGTCS